MKIALVVLRSLLGVCLLGKGLLAHEEFKVIGIVTKVTESELEVKTRTGKLVSMGIGLQTGIMWASKQASHSDLKKGQNVIVKAFGDSYEDLGALQVDIVKVLPSGPVRVTPSNKKGN